MRASRRLPPESLAPYLLDVPHPGHLPPDDPALAPKPPLDWRDIFGNDHPVEIEVGFGKGLFLLVQSQARPDANFLGIEIERKYVLHTAARLAKAQGRLSLGGCNVKLACTDARWFLRERVAEATVAAIHVYFPDPWWKKRHKKRKLLTPDFVEQCARVLQVGGRLHFATDVEEYYAESLEIFASIAALRALPPPTEQDAMTNFERKYRAEGRPIHRAQYERRRAFV